jgi:hypothetical protein
MCRQLMAVNSRELLNDGGKMHTLYITPLTDDFSTLKETTQTDKGVKVRLWTDGDRFFGLASP